MSACEKCWGDAYTRSLDTGHSQPDCYHKILIERTDNPCSPEEQAGQWWDEETQSDTRNHRKED